jgi:mono/diheme cytochrome c family protein
MNNSKSKQQYKILKSVTMTKILICLSLLLFTSPLYSVSLEEQKCCIDRWDPWWLKRDVWVPDAIMPGHRKRMARHRAFMHSDIPAEYHGQKNPLTPSESIIQEGAVLYRLHCANCHGAEGMGNGVEGLGLSPSPALLSYMVHTPLAVDEYMMWTISDGGTQFGTDMPAFKRILVKKDIWKIITFMRAGFPYSKSK